jgi:hypothetical protein
MQRRVAINPVLVDGTILDPIARRLTGEQRRKNFEAEQGCLAPKAADPHTIASLEVRHLRLAPTRMGFILAERNCE